MDNETAPQPDAESDLAELNNSKPFLHRRALIGDVGDFIMDKATANPTFGSAEHIEIGEFVRIEAPADYTQAGAMTASFAAGKLNFVVNGPALSYGQIIALAGDLYGIPGQAISDGADQASREHRFLQSFETLRTADVKELDELLRIMAREKTAVESRLVESADHDYGPRDEDFDSSYARATGGTYLGTLSSDSRYMNLAKTNFDHFGPDALKAYKAGHSLALQKARQAFELGRTDKNGALGLYELALAYNAFADHFLSDLFAGGHLRVPRRAANFQHGDSYGSILVKCQHDEDNELGVFVTNRKGDHWRCYGDSHLNTQQGDDNARRVKGAIRVSYQEVYDAFATGRAPSVDDYEAVKLKPDLDEVQKHGLKTEAGEHLNFASALIPVKQSGVLKVSARQPIKDRDSHHWEVTIHQKYQQDNRKISEIIETYQMGLDTFSTPADVLPAPKKAPEVRLAGYSGNKGNGQRVRYAYADIGEKTYPGGGKGRYSSGRSPWSAWVKPVPGQAPEVILPAASSPRVKQRAVIRHVEGRKPDFNAFLEGNLISTSIHDEYV